MGREEWMKESGGISQITHMYDPWTQTIMWGCLGDGRRDSGEGIKGDKMGSTVIA